MDDDDDLARGFSERLQLAMGTTSQAVVAKRARISTGAMSKYLNGSEPGLLKAARLAKALDVSLHWLATGEGAPSASSFGYVGLPIFDVRLSAGTASFSDAAREIGTMPFDMDLLRALGRANGDGLGVLEAEGDSMEPLISDGARVVIDFKDTRLREKVFAFRFDDELRLKRLRRTIDGIEILSENPRYEPELLSGEALNRFQILGRALWSGSML
ncbi:LexA family transcriptional regulator [Brevundimonas vitis]|uniref:LexA family transcriptional regulator n=1 Tax=Brevundimonas vitisensis TaxID=2800818 RepID=A0ABX7BJP5_9CAUL|nr:LexA family transcriptional regulator [Brevundimonas vitisensis]QQQ17783.1 LexA family transcriptional regulator [Brevundimonas vitisensis]